MGCCLPRKKCVSIITTTKKSSQIRTSKYEKVLDRLHFSKSLVNFELQKYYASGPIQILTKDSFLKTYFFSPNHNKLADNNGKNQKKIKESMRRLKELSSIEVHNCQKYFFMNEKHNNIWWINSKIKIQKYEWYQFSNLKKILSNI